MNCIQSVRSSLVPLVIVMSVWIWVGIRGASGQDPLRGEHWSYFPPPDSKEGWRRATDLNGGTAAAGMDRNKLDEALSIAEGSTKNGGLLVVRRGWLVYERYFGLGHREATCNLASCGKSVTSIAVGMLMAERPDLFPDGLDQKVFTTKLLPPEAFPLSDTRKSEIKLGQLLTMTAGIRGNNPAFVRGVASTLDPVGPDGASAMADPVALGMEDREMGSRTVSAKTLWCDPGEGYSYATSSIHLTSIMLRHSTGQELAAYVDSHLAQPLGWERWGFGYKQSKQVTHTPGGGGIVLRPTDMLRFGYLLIREGRWGDRQLMSMRRTRGRFWI
jgi:CubicO group peptidase (beta-lactamase class C family)